VALIASGSLLAAGVRAGATFPAPSNGDIVFASTYVSPCTMSPCRIPTAPHPGGSFNLWLVNPAMINTSDDSSSYDPTATYQLTDTTGTDDSPSFSPDGSEVVFARNTTGRYQIWLVATSNRPTAEDQSTTTTAGQVAADGAERLTSDSKVDTDPSFSPDGHTIVFIQGGTKLVTLNADDPGGPETTIVSDSIALDRPVFDPVDPSKLLYADADGHIILVTGVGTGSQQSYDLSAASGIDSNSEDEYPDWSPTGNTIVFDSTRPVNGDASQNNQLWTMTYSLSGNTLTASASPVFVGSSGVGAYSGSTDTQPVWSPDGTQLAWTRTLSNEDVEAEMLRLSPGDHIAVTATPIDLTMAPSNPTDDEPNWTGTAYAPDVQNLVATVAPGTLTISTPYGPGNSNCSTGEANGGPGGSNPSSTCFTGTGTFNLGQLVLNSAGTLLSGSATFPNPAAGYIVVTSTRAGDPSWTASVTATDLTSGTNKIYASNLGLTGWSLIPLAGNAIQSGDVSFSNIPAEPGAVSDAPSGGVTGLAGGPHKFATSTAGDGTAQMNATLTLNAPTSTPAGTYVGTITFTVI
jgi:Tol biopolymer transport system component